MNKDNSLNLQFENLFFRNFEFTTNYLLIDVKNNDEVFISLPFQNGSRFMEICHCLRASKEVYCSKNSKYWVCPVII